ncbi:DUF488 family protein [Naasia sp. SYSU D00057]|uniref:DUF488 domain-containing protein n=1 Tax=Naasia sp. SYSU D00057 TaxID=2817380 RepID=UPI001B30EBAE|nr:DUF488 domain-containing protein [Naasia sp. SYSU D00057]
MAVDAPPPAETAEQGLRVFTIGHSTHPIDEFLGILHAHGIGLLVDVRTVPRSRTNPQFNEDALAASLPEGGIRYIRMPALGGLRHPRRDSPNGAWRNDSFRGYADHMQTPEFAAAIEELIERARDVPTAIMCAEAVPWRCHRSMIGDALVARSITVLDILSATSARPHVLRPFARLDGDRVTYPAEQET